MKSPLVIDKGRFRIIVSGDALRIDVAGSGGLLVILTDAEKRAISKALWYR
jgi:hypothetical protein